MKHIAYVQTYMVDLPSWYAAYIKEMKNSGDEQKAFDYGDFVVEQVQGSGNTKDMAQVMRNQSHAHRIFTMFMTFFSSAWNAQRDVARGARGRMAGGRVPECGEMGSKRPGRGERAGSILIGNSCLARADEATVARHCRAEGKVSICRSNGTCVCTAKVLVEARVPLRLRI